MKTREEWLQAAVRKMEPWLLEHNVRMPKQWAVSCGWCRGRAKAVGQCWDPKVSSEGVTEMFISPVLSAKVEAGTQGVLDTLLHEMVHAAVGIDQKHGGEFKRVARALKLEGKLTSTYPGEELANRLKGLDLPPYPHAAINPLAAGEKPSKGGYWPVYVSPVNPDYRVQIRPAALDEFGPPICPISGDEMVLSQGRGK